MTELYHTNIHGWARMHTNVQYKDKNTSILTHTQSTMATTALVPSQNLPFISIAKPIWLLSSLGWHLWGRKYFPKHQKQNFPASHGCKVKFPPFHVKSLFVFGNALQHAPDTSLCDINLIKMICPNSVINQAEQKWQVGNNFYGEISKLKYCWGHVIPKHLIWLTSLALLSTRCSFWKQALMYHLAGWSEWWYHEYEMKSQSVIISFFVVFSSRNFQCHESLPFVHCI